MKKARGFSLASEIPVRKFDQNSETIRELHQSTGQSLDWLRDYAKAQVKAGKWEMVYKKAERQIVPAYRRKAPTRIDSEVTIAK